jgi:neutral ceramidase
MQYYFKSIPIDGCPEALNLSGFGRRSMKKRLGLGSLTVSVLWLKFDEDSDDQVYISVDTLYIPLKISTPIYKYLRKKYQFSPCQIIFNASHTHSAPALEELFAPNEYVDSKYVEYVLERLLSIFQEVKKNSFLNGIISFKQIDVPSCLTISRRKIGFDVRSFYLKKKMIMLPNSKNKIDDKIRLFIIYDHLKKIDIVLYNLSCHPVFDDGYQVSSDFIGVINNYLFKEKNIKGMFLQGFLGDIRPNFTTRNLLKVSLVNKTKIIMNGDVFKPFAKSDINVFCSKISKGIIGSCYEKSDLVTDNLSSNTFQKEYSLASDTGMIVKKLIVKILVVNNLVVISIPAEVTSRYYVELSILFPKCIIMPLSNADGVLGYLPFYKEVLEGGYEIESSLNYGWDSKISYDSLRSFFKALILDLTTVLEVLR